MLPRRQTMRETSNNAADNILEIIRRQDSLTGSLTWISQLFKNLSQENETKAFIYQMEEKLKAEEKKTINDKAEALDWVKQKLSDLKKNFSNIHPIVTAKIKETEKLINYETIKIHQNFVTNVWDSVTEIVQFVVGYGDNKVFYDWVEIEIKKDSLPNNKLFSESNKIIAINTNDKKGKALINLIRHGFINATFIPKQFRPGSEQSSIEVEFGILRKINSPSCLQMAYKNDLKSFIKETKDLKTDAFSLFKYLRILASFQEFKDFELQTARTFQNWQEIDGLSEQAIARLYFCEPYSLLAQIWKPEELFGIAETFLFMARSHPKKLSRIYHNKIDAKKFAYDFIKNIVIKSNFQPSALPSNETVFIDIKNAAQIRNEPFAAAISSKLTDTIYREILKEHGIKRKGGRLANPK